MRTITPTELRENIYRLLDQVIETGVPIEIKYRGKKLRLIPMTKIDKFQDLEYRPEIIRGNPEDLIHIEWEVDHDLA